MKQLWALLYWQMKCYYVFLFFWLSITRLLSSSLKEWISKWRHNILSILNRTKKQQIHFIVISAVVFYEIDLSSVNNEFIESVPILWNKWNLYRFHKIISIIQFCIRLGEFFLNRFPMFYLWNIFKSNFYMFFSHFILNWIQSH